MPLDFRTFFDYYKRERAKLFEEISKMSEEDFTRNRELSFNSIKDVLVHTVMVEDNWLHYRAAGLGNETSKKFQDFKTLNDVVAYAQEVDKKTELLFSRLKETDLSKVVERTYPDGRKTSYLLGQVLYHVPIEIIHHYGEIFAEFWKINVDAPYYSYLAFAKEKGFEG
ncbi:MAG: DinB family protein [Thermoprotei archaeon]